MATKTLILRPTSITSSDESKVTLYPSDTTMANAHMLVNEETADDDATYIIGGLGSTINYHFSFTMPSDLKNILGFSFVVRHKMDASSSNHSVQYRMALGSGEYLLGTLTTNPTAYDDMFSALDEDTTDEIISSLSGTTTSNFYVEQIVATGNNKSKPIRTTQMYIEITYENNTSTIQYVKQNGIWVNIGELNFYYKRNGSWRKRNDNELDQFLDKNYAMGVIE